VLPNEWLPLVWGGEAPEFADESEAKAVLGAIMARYNEILHQIADDTFDPIFWTARGGTLIAADWAEGFLQAIMLRMDAWDRLLKSKRDGQLLIPILALCGDENGESLLGLPPEDEDRIMQEAVEFVPACVTDANLDAAHARPIVSSAPIRKQGWSQRSVPLRVRQEVQEMLRQGRLKSVADRPRYSPDAYYWLEFKKNQLLTHSQGPRPQLRMARRWGLGILGLG
jgi:yecA family protein